MTTESTRVSLDELVAGMVLATDAVHLNGRVLLSAGTCLTEKHLKVFRTWGLMEAQIKSGGGERSEGMTETGLDPEIVEQARTFMQARFSMMDQTAPPVSELFRICVRSYAEHLTSGRGNAWD